MKVEAKSFDEYFAKAGEREPALREIDSLIRENAPNCKRELFQNMGGGAAIGYGMMPYQSSSMKEPGQWPIIALANQKNYMAIYACATVDGKYIAEEYGKQLGKVNVGRSCIRFKKFQDLNLDVVKKMLKELDSHYASGKKLFG